MNYTYDEPIKVQEKEVAEDSSDNGIDILVFILNLFVLKLY